MELSARPPATLVDLLDRVLDRGLVINADIIISLAGVPLIGINLRAALAGMETMVKYGLMADRDARLRGREAEGSGGNGAFPLPLAPLLPELPPGPALPS